MRQYPDYNGNIKDTANALNEIFKSSILNGIELLESFSRTGTSLFDQLYDSSKFGEFIKRQKTSRSCNIPPPCWLPKSLGEITTYAGPCGCATLKIRVTNCGIQRKEFTVNTKQAVIPISVSPAAIALDSMERGIITLTAQLPQNSTAGEEKESLIWLQGCNKYYLRWTVKVVSCATDSCHEVEVNDCPDPIHHWYDHFYCYNPCSHK